MQFQQAQIIAVCILEDKQHSESTNMPAASEDQPGVGQVALELTQTVLDNMGEGVALFDPDLQLQLINRQLVTFQSYPSALARIGTQLEAIIRFQTERGDFGKVCDVEATIGERLASMRQAS